MNPRDTLFDSTSEKSLRLRYDPGATVAREPLLEL
jgi:hypothetical protein